MNLAVRSILSVLAVGAWAQTTMANYNAAATSTASAMTIQQPKKEGRNWGGLVSMNRSASLVDYQDGTREDGAEYMGRFNVKLGANYAIMTQAGYSQDLNYSEKDDFTDTSVNLLRTPVKVGQNFLLGYRVTAIAPTSKDSHKRQSLQTSLSTGLSAQINPDRLIPGLEIAGSISVGRNFHQYETALDGKVNNQYSSAQALTLGYAFKYGISLSAEFIHKNAWSYQNVMKDVFEMSQELSFAFNPALAVAIGHTNSGSSLRANGNESNVQLVNETTSIIYGSLTATF